MSNRGTTRNRHRSSAWMKYAGLGLLAVVAIGLSLFALTIRG